MTTAETAKLLARMAASYPATFSKIDEHKTMVMIEAWSGALAEYSAEETNAALDRLIKSSRFCPALAELIDAIQQTRHDNWLIDISMAAAKRTYEWVAEQERKRGISNPSAEVPEIVVRQIMAPFEQLQNGGKPSTYQNHTEGAQ